MALPATAYSFSSSNGDTRDLHSFPTRRSSDLAADYVRLGKPTLERFRISGDGPMFCKLGGAVRYRKADLRSEEHTSELQSRRDLVCRLLLEKKKNNKKHK